MHCHYWHFLDKNFNYGPYLCDGYYNIAQKSNDFEKIATIHVGESAYRLYFPYMSKREARKLMNNSNLVDKKRCFMKFVIYRKAWFNRQSEEKQNEMREKAREYSRNRYHNRLVAVH